MSHNSSDFIDNNKGIALVITLLITTILVVLILEFNFDMIVELNLSGNFRDEAQAYYYAKSGINFGIGIINKDDNDYDSFYEDSYRAFSFIAEGIDNKKCLLVPVGKGQIRICISDENSKFNMNYLHHYGNKLKQTPGIIVLKRQQMLQRLLNIIEVPSQSIDEVYDSIVNWTDPNSKKLSGKKAPFDTISEIGLLDVMEEDILISLGANKDIFGNINTSVLKYFTIFSDGLINLNTALPEVIESLDENVTIDMAEEVITEREEPFIDFNDMSRRVENIMGTTIWNNITKEKNVDVKSNYFLIESTGMVPIGPENSITDKITAVIESDRKAHTSKIIYWKEE